MKRRIICLLAAALLLLSLLSGCGSVPEEALNAAGAVLDALSEPETSAAPEAPAASEALALPETAESAGIAEDGEYTSPEDVALYISTYGALPGNFITKSEAKALGWDSGEGNLWDVAPGRSIGGDRFGNYEELLPEGNYTECDVNYAGGFRGAERIIFSDMGEIYYTGDHYESFTQLY